MHMLGTLTSDKPRTLVLIALAVIAVHLVSASLFFLDSPLGEKLAWAALALLGTGVAASVYGSLGNTKRGLLALAFALPAVITGIGVHAIHVHELGVQDSGFTGVAMLFAGVLLLVTGGTVLVRSVHDWWRRLAFIPAAVLVLVVAFPVTLAVFATNVPKIPADTGDTPADYGLAYEDVSFEDERGNTLSAWYLPSSNGAAIITVHGAGHNRSRVLDEAAMLARHGYGVLMVDLEGFGDSEGRANAFGWTGARGIHAATAYLAARDDLDPGRIGGLGLSMGGEVLLQAAGESSALAAIVAEGATARTAADFGELKDSDAMYVFHTVVGVTMELISGEDPPPPLKQLVQQIAPRDVFLIGGNLKEELELMTMYYELGGPSFELWFTPESRHIAAFDLHPEEYEQRVVSFFNRSLLPGAQYGLVP